MSENAQFSSDITDRELQQLLIELAAPHVSGAGLTEDDHQFQFNVKTVAGDTIRIEPLPPLSRALKDGEIIQLVCGLPSGLVWAKSKLRQEKINEFSLSLSPQASELKRIQRRTAVRTPVPREVSFSFKLTSLANAALPTGTELKLRDLSTGGFRADWPLGSTLTPAVDQHLSGLLTYPKGRPMELFGTIKSTQLVSGSQWQVGVEFQPLGLKDEQTLLFVCLKALTHPENYMHFGILMREVDISLEFRCIASISTMTAEVSWFKGLEKCGLRLPYGLRRRHGFTHRYEHRRDFLAEKPLAERSRYDACESRALVRKPHRECGR